MIDGDQVAVPARLGHGVALPGGEILLVPADLEAAVMAAIDAARGAATVEAWRTAFGEALVRALHGAGLILVSRGRQASRETVDADVYSLALSMKYAAERRLGAVTQLLGVLPEIGSLGNHVQDVVDALTGHAPPRRSQALTAALDERVRALRLAVFGTPMDAPLSDPEPTDGEIACPIR